MATIGDGFKDIFLAGIGAMAITAEKSKDLVDQLISKGELTVDQGKQINTELKHKAEDVAASVRYDVLEARMAAMTPEERRRPELLNASRKRRIAAGSGRSVEEINRLLKSYEQTKALLKRFNKNPKAFGGMGGMNGLGM